MKNGNKRTRSQTTTEPVFVNQSESSDSQSRKCVFVHDGDARFGVGCVFHSFHSKKASRSRTILSLLCRICTGATVGGGSEQRS